MVKKGGEVKKKYDKKENGKNDTGRPTTYSQKTADLICEKLSEWMSLRSVCDLDGMPAWSTVFKWIREHDEFSKQYTKAKEESADALVEEILDIADNSTNDWMEVNDPDNPWYRFNWDHYQRSRMRVDVRKWIASKMKPKKYGDKLAIWWDWDMDPIKSDTTVTIKIV